jgi:hypothetical protein
VKFASLGFIASALLATMMLVAPAQAQATRTWVSGVGDDANPCSRTAPCKTFAGAISKTAPGGQINCLDPGGFGAVTITKSIGIECPTFPASVLVSGTNGIVISAAATDVVRLVGLDIDGLGTGLSGIKVLSAGGLELKNCFIHGFITAGIDIEPNSAMRLDVIDTQVWSNAPGGTSTGVFVRPAAAGSANVTLTNTNVHNNFRGMQLDGTNGAVKATLKDTVVANNSEIGLIIESNAVVMVKDSVFSNNATGIKTSNGSPFFRIGTSVVTGNGTAVTIGAGSGTSYGTNQINDNTALGSTLTIVGPN